MAATRFLTTVARSVHHALFRGADVLKQARARPCLTRMPSGAAGAGAAARSAAGLCRRLPRAGRARGRRTLGSRTAPGSTSGRSPVPCGGVTLQAKLSCRVKLP